MVCEAGETAMLKSGGGAAVTVSDAVAECVVVDVPVTVKVVAVAVAGVVTGSVPSEAVAPAGTPWTLRVTDSAVPLTTAVLIVTFPPAPCPNDRLLGVAAIEKSLPTAAPQPGNLKDAMRVLQLNVPFAGMYSVASQKVQSSTGSMDNDA